MKILKTNKVKAAGRGLVTMLAHEIIEKCPKHRPKMISDPRGNGLSINTHFKYFERRLVDAIFIDRQRILDDLEILSNELDIEHWRPTPEEFLNQVVKIINHHSGETDHEGDLLSVKKIKATKFGGGQSGG